MYHFFPSLKLQNLGSHSDVQLICTPQNLLILNLASDTAGETPPPESSIKTTDAGQRGNINFGLERLTFNLYERIRSVGAASASNRPSLIIPTCDSVNTVFCKNIK